MRLFGACIQTHQIDLMIDFYKRLFELEPDLDGGVDYRFYAAQLVVFKLEDENAPQTKNLALIYEVDDVDAAYTRVVCKSILAEPPTDKPWGVRSFVVKDPDGNTVSFFENIKKP